MSNPIYSGSDDLSALNYRARTTKNFDPSAGGLGVFLGNNYDELYESGGLVYDASNKTFKWATADSKPLLFSSNDDSNVVEPKVVETPKEGEKKKDPTFGWKDFGEGLMDLASENRAYQYNIFGGEDVI